MNKTYSLLPEDLYYFKTVNLGNASLKPHYNHLAENAMLVFMYLMLSLLDSRGDKYVVLLVLEEFEKQQRSNSKS